MTQPSVYNTPRNFTSQKLKIDCSPKICQSPAKQDSASSEKQTHLFIGNLNCGNCPHNSVNRSLCKQFVSNRQQLLAMCLQCCIITLSIFNLLAEVVKVHWMYGICSPPCAITTPLAPVSQTQLKINSYHLAQAYFRPLLLCTIIWIILKVQKLVKKIKTLILLL